MEAGGGYNRRSQVQAAGLSPAVPLLEQAARTVALPPDAQLIVLADYGASEGRNSLVPLATAIRALRERAGTERAISVIHTDLPENDFSALFQTLATDPDSYLRNDPAVFPAAVGRSFYRQILPPGSVSLGWSSWAVQWLSRAPMPVPDQVQVAYSQDAATRAAFAAQADQDWRAFLLHRGHELHAGGKLVVLTMASTDDGAFGYAPVLAAIYGGLCDMQASGFLGADELHRMTIPTVGRRRADFLAPFDAKGRFGALRVEQIEIFQGEDRIWTEFIRTGDAPAFGARWAAFSRASVFPTLAAGLEGGHADPRGAAFIDRLEAAMAARLAAAPERMLIPLARMVFAKDG